MAVFHRPPDYDANADPIVRVTAGEIRKRIAQYYHEEDAAGEIQIDLRPGSYVPEFHPVAFVATEIAKPSGEFPAASELPVPIEVKSPPLTSSTGHRSALEEKRTRHSVDCFAGFRDLSSRCPLANAR